MQRERAIRHLRSELARGGPGEDGAPRLIVEGHVSLQAAGHLRSRLLEAIDGSTEEGYLLVDLAGVESMDTAAVAVLVEGLAAGRDKNSTVVLCGPSRQLRDLFRLTGLEGSTCGCGSCKEEARRLHLAVASQGPGARGD